MLLVALWLVWSAASIQGFIPPRNICNQDKEIPNACVYGNLSVAVVGKVFKPSDCNSNINLTDLDRPPYLYINSTNSTERFTIIMVDLGPQGRGPDYLQWMITNISINTPDYKKIPPYNTLVEYMPPLLMQGISHSTLVQILVFRHWNVLRVPFGELWVSRRRNFELSTLYSNTAPTLRLCGPVAATQYWVHNIHPAPQSGYVPVGSAPSQPGYIPVAPVQPGFAPGQSGYVPPPGQAGYVPAPGQTGYSSVPGQPSYILTNQQQPHASNPKKSLGAISQPFQLLLVVFAVFTCIFT